MRIIRSVREMAQLAAQIRIGGKSIALVPTMGALHRGHLSLLATAREHADVTIMSIFVNPAQFGPSEDYSKYPRPFEEDCRKAREANCDLLFAPSAEEMYTEHHRTIVSVSGITERLCGAPRRGHFQGVTTVVLKLFNIVNPDVAVFGAKDAQQVVVLRRMGEDLNCPVRIIEAPIVREPDGLALSSRNVYLTAEERSAALYIGSGLRAAAAACLSGERRAEALAAIVRGELARSPLIEPEYVEIVDQTTLEPVTMVSSAALAAVACRMCQSFTRLIDNTVLREKQ